MTKNLLTSLISKQRETHFSALDWSLVDIDRAHFQVLESFCIDYFHSLLICNISSAIYENALFWMLWIKEKPKLASWVYETDW